jgi:hypothetical protein
MSRACLCSLAALAFLWAFAVKADDPKSTTGDKATKTFRLTEDMEYIYSSGRVVTLDVFRAGDRVLLVEEEGQLRGMRQPSTQTPTIGSRRNQIKKQ